MQTADHHDDNHDYHHHEDKELVVGVRSDALHGQTKTLTGGINKGFVYAFVFTLGIGAVQFGIFHH